MAADGEGVLCCRLPTAIEHPSLTAKQMTLSGGPGKKRNSTLRGSLPILERAGADDGS